MGLVTENGPRQPSPEAGFTIIEAAWTAGILAVVILALGVVIAQSINVNIGSEAQALAADEAERVMEEMWGRNFDTVLVDYPPTATEIDGETFYVAQVGLSDEGAQVLQSMDGSANDIEVIFLTEAQAQGEWGQDSLDLDDDDVTGESEQPAVGWQSLPILVRVSWELPDPRGGAEQFTYEVKSFLYELPE